MRYCVWCSSPGCVSLDGVDYVVGPEWFIARGWRQRKDKWICKECLNKERKENDANDANTQP